VLELLPEGLLDAVEPEPLPIEPELLLEPVPIEPLLEESELPLLPRVPLLESCVDPVELELGLLLLLLP
jgi:hypothetical protein